MNVSEMSREQLEALVQQQAQANKKAIVVKVSQKGCVQINGIRRFPITFYKNEWEQIFSMKDEIVQFIEDNDHFYYLKVYFEDTDAGQIVYHTNYLKYFERARTSLLNLLKIDQVELRKKHNIILVVRKADLIWYKPALLNDLLLIKTCLKYAKNSSITITQSAYRVMNLEEEYELLVKGIIQIVAINNEFKVKRINRSYLI